MKLYYALGIVAVGCPCLGVGAWQIYEEVNPTLDRALWKEGQSRNPISPGPLKTQEVSSNSPTDYLSKEKYGCVQWFFPGIDPSENNARESSAKNLTNPFSTDASSPSSSPVLGCALMKLVPKDGGKFFLKSEIAFKNDTQGWVIWAHLTNYNHSASDKTFLYFRIFFLGRNSTSDAWSIKGGVYLRHYGSVVSGSPVVSTPNGEWKDYTKEQHYAGFWESSGTPETGKGLMTDIKIEYGSHNKLFSGGSIHTTTGTHDGLTCKGIYDASNNKWSTWDNGNKCCISGALTQAFQSFKEKKGTWTDAAVYCNEVGNTRYHRVDENTKKRAKELCYLQNSNTE